MFQGHIFRSNLDFRLGGKEENGYFQSNEMLRIILNHQADKRNLLCKV